MKPQPTHRQANVINLMDALRRSVEGDKAAAAARRKKASARVRRRTARGARKGKARMKKAG